MVPEGYSAVVIEVAKADGTKRTYCVWLAEIERPSASGA